MRSLLALFLLLWPAASSAQTPTFADGLYEDFPSILMRPVGPLAGVPPTGHWVEVTSRGARTTVRFLPDGRMRWVIRWGPHGPRSKRIVVDGVTVATSTFGYDAAGHLVAKDVTRAGAPDLHFDYTTDGSGRVTERRGRLPPLGGTTPTVERAIITYTASGSEEVVERDGRAVRRDLRDAAGRLLESHFVSGSETASLVYERDGAGTLLEAVRAIGGVREEAGFAAPRPDLVLHVELVSRAPIERWETLLLFGAPARSTDAGRGAGRTISDDWSGDACLLNRVSLLRFDAAGLLVGAETTCICGFCVAAESVVSEGEEVLATDTHWWSGPWVVLDGVWVTPDHEVLTPRGPRRATTLVIGEPVMHADGRAAPLAQVEHVASTEPRRALNLRTADGTFVGGDLVFLSEAEGPCPR